MSAVLETVATRSLGGTKLPIYKPRHLRFLELWQPGFWKFKVYIHSAHAERLPARFRDRAFKFVETKLQEIDVVAPHHHVGFLILSHGTIANWIILDWWSTILLYQQLYRSDETPPVHFSPAPPKLVQCIWELRITAFEREAWIEHILSKKDGPDLDGYLNARFNGDV